MTRDQLKERISVGAVVGIIGAVIGVITLVLSIVVKVSEFGEGREEAATQAAMQYASISQQIASLELKITSTAAQTKAHVESVAVAMSNRIDLEAISSSNERSNNAERIMNLSQLHHDYKEIINDKLRNLEDRLRGEIEARSKDRITFSMFDRYILGAQRVIPELPSPDTVREAGNK